MYRARDARLERDVAIKVLPERLADSAEALARFEREARALARGCAVACLENGLEVITRA